MGAAQFTDTATGATLREAFNDAHARACYDYGHAGYTGTLAEKYGVIEFIPPTGVTVEEVLNALNNSYSYMTRDAAGKWVEEPAQRPAWAPSNWDTITKTYNDKWADAVAIRHPDDPNTWTLTGWASS